MPRPLCRFISPAAVLFSAALSLTPAAGHAAEPDILCQLQIQAADQVFDGVLFDTPIARDIAARLPLEVRMGRWGSREFYGSVDFTPPQSGAGQLYFSDGDITFCFQNNTMAIFYQQTDRPNLTMEVYPAGRVTSDLASFNDLPGRTVFVFSRAAEQEP